MSGFDTGGLNWKLQVEDAFSGVLQQFAKELQAAKAALDAFRGDKTAFNQTIEQLRTITELTKAQTSASKEARSVQSQADREEAAAQRELIAQVKARTQAEKERGAIIRQQKADQEAAAKAALGLDAAVAKTAGSVGATAKAVDKARPATQGLAAQFKGLGQALFGGAEAGNRLVFTLRNIIGVGAGLAFIQKIQQGFSDLVRSGINFNAEVENTTTGVAGLLTALVNVRTTQGQLLTGADAFNATFTVAQTQVDKLRQATLRTTATFEQLANTFQVALGPGLKAGLNIDQIRNLAVSVSQAAGALGVPTNQLSEEIRALLTGTIQARTTRIATALGITPDDIKKAKNDVGGLSKFLDDRFKAFELAGERAAGTFTGTFNRAKTALTLVSGEAAKGLFEEIRTSFLSVFDLVTQRDNLGNLLPKPEAVQVLRAIFDGLAGAVVAIRDALKQITFADILGAAQTLGGIFKGFGEFVSGFIRGAINGFATLGRVFGNAFSAIDLAALGRTFGEIILLVGTLGAGFKALQVAVGLFLLPLSSLLGTLRTLSVVAKGLGISPPFIAAAIAISAAYIAAKNLLHTLEDVQAINRASTPEAQLSKAAQLRGQLTDAVKNQQKALEALNAREKEIGAEGSVIFSLTGLQTDLDNAVKRVNEVKIQLRRQIAADLVNPAQGGPDNSIPVPDLQDTSLLAQLKDIQKAIQDAFSPPEDTGAGKFLHTMEDIAAEAEAVAHQFDKGFNMEPKGRELTQFEKAFMAMSDTVKEEIGIATSAVQQFASFASDVIVDAFDPTKKKDLTQRFAEFLQGIAKTIIATLTQIAVAKAVLGIFGGPATGPIIGAAEGGAVPGFAEGGPVEAPAPQHFGLKAPRPKGLDPSDTVAAWLAPGEFVQKATAVARYGVDFMDRLNRGLVNPSDLRALAGLSAARSSNARRVGRISGFADGGLISQQLTASAAAQARATSSQQSPGVVQAAIVGNDLTMDRLLAGGHAAVLRYFKENAASLDGILSTARR